MFLTLGLLLLQELSLLSKAHYPRMVSREVDCYTFDTEATKPQCVQLRLDSISTGHIQIIQALELEITGGQ